MQWKMTIGWFLILEYQPLIIELSCSIVSSIGARWWKLRDCDPNFLDGQAWMMAKAAVAAVDAVLELVSGQGTDSGFSLDSKTHPFEK